MTNVQRPFGRTITGLLLFGISFGYVEAAVVVYLRGLLEPVRRQVQPNPPDSPVVRPMCPGITTSSSEAIDMDGLRLI